MYLKPILKTAATLTALAATSAFASSDVIPSENDTFTKWGEESGWTIFVDETRGSCLIERVDENNNVVQMGLTKDQEMGYLGVFTQNNIGLKGKKEKIFLSLDGNVYEAEARKKTKHLAEGYTGGYILANNAQFVDDVMKKYEMTVFPEKEFAFTVSLDGTLKAIEAARTCNSEQSS
ncbi:MULTISPECIES: hypothetical protein [unclassified Ruegeria]|uniref:hypothetical protein n=1 Tax=unclassified Ruegeria TaxID=2625375 RepID=UPI001490F358|nr:MULTISPECIES: hypothetical protein [unclassified Ruegeria]NOD34870.1 hypothetical protein [Ruegeria sp. HKCCD7296]NOD48050.1 hypothetical protein [Ruegeria sp. HKCCD5849]NOD53034.1 hypothetical protein [Ruegeria sp. HKCCD5851]NOD69180.1 hypothetical protein [Ruegeria sp. HKCCD7303]NOE42153.1 hypothetical protein [Ruegeria sp. HKCCD7319]